MGTFFRYTFYLAILVVLGYIGMSFYNYYENNQPLESETIVISKN